MNIFTTRFNKLCFTLLTLLTFGVSSVWAGDCNYTVNNLVSSKNTEKNGNTYWAFGTRNYYDVPTFEFGNVTNNYGISHVKLSLKFSGVHAVTEKFQLQYKVNNGSWTNIGSQVTVGVTTKNIDENVSIAGAANQKVYFQLARVEKAKFTDTQTLSLSNFEVRMAPTVSADPTSVNFGSVTYGQNKSEEVTAYYTLKASGNMTVSCTGDFSATVTAGCNCSTSQQSKTVTVTFTPTKAGTRNGVLTITNPDGSTKTTVDLTGTGVRANQTLTMTNGSVNATTNKSNPTTINLSNLCTHVGNGAVTYELVSAPNALNGKSAADSCVINNTNKTFHAWVAGTYILRAKAAVTDQYNAVTSDNFTITVNRVANTLAFYDNKTSDSRFVEETKTNAVLTNSNATIQTSSTNGELAYLRVADKTIYIPNSNNQSFTTKVVDIKVWQDATDVYASAEKTLTLEVKKYVTTSNGNDIILKVNETLQADYGFTNTSAAYPSSNLNEDFYYTIDEPNFDNAALNNGNELITYNPSTNEITGHNAGTTKITFFQEETYKYTGATLMCNIAVEKRDNQIASSWGDTWQKAMDENGATNISFTSTHADYVNYPISIEQIYGEDVATLTGNASGASIQTNTTKGYAIWHLSQAENYEYYAAEADVLVTVGVPAPPTCYVYQDFTEHEFMTGINDAEGHFDAPIAINSPVDKIWFYAKKSKYGYNYFKVQYSKDNGKEWKTLSSPDLDKDYKSEPFVATFPTLQGTERITHVRLGAATGATLSKWYKNVQISRKAYINILNAEQKKISKLPTMECTIDETSTAEAKFYIDYSTCADEIIIESSNPEYFTVNKSQITANGDNLTSAKEEITVTYHSEEIGTHNAVITIRTSYQTSALSVSGETTKRTPSLTWQEGYTNNPLTLPVGLTVNAIKPAATSTSTAAVMYESSNEDVIQILENGYAFKVVGVGSAVLTASVPENDKWKSVSDTRVVNATEKIVQEIVWDQTFPRFMNPGDVIDLNAQVFLRNLSTGVLTYSAERTPLISYSCPLNNGIATVSGDKMTVLDYGEVKVTASVEGNADYAAAASVTMLINVRQPSAGCETPLVLHKTEAIDMFEMNIDFSDYGNLTTEEMISDELVFNPTQGKPDKLSFQYEGEEFNAIVKKYFGGHVKFEQRVNLQWLPVEGSRVETEKNAWNTKSDLQLDENADALRIIREAGATGHHYIKDIQVTRKQYLRNTQNTINLGEITLGEATPVIIGFDYSDVKGDLTARTINNTTDLTIKNNGIIDTECGSFGHYDLQVTFTPTQLDAWEGTVEVYDNIANLSITVTLTATVTANEEYIFNQEGNWNTSTNWTTNLVPDENTDITVAADMIINSSASVKSITIEDGVTVTVKKGMTLAIGNGSPKSLATYGNLHVEVGAQVILNDGASLMLNDMILDAQLGNTSEHAASGQISNTEQLNVNGKSYFQMSFDPSGAISYGWYDFTVPFAVNINGGIARVNSSSDKVMVNNTDFIIMEADEQNRANGGKGWRRMSGGVLQPGKLYTITLDDEVNQNTLRFTWNGTGSLNNGASYTTQFATGSADNTLHGWNGIGNGMLRHGYPACSYKMQSYNHATNTYELVTGNNTFAVGSAFFVQVPAAGNLNWTVAESTKDRPLFAPKKEAQEIDEFRLSLRREESDNDADVLYFSASEEATEKYVIGSDLLKMGTPTEAKVAQMWATKGGKKLCDVETTLLNDNATTPLTFFTPQAGEYIMNVDEKPEDASLYLTYNNQVIWDLTEGAYRLELEKGTTEGYGLSLQVRRAPQITTDVENANAEGKNIRKVLIDNTIYIVTPEGEIYDIMGKNIK